MLTDPTWLVTIVTTWMMRRILKILSSSETLFDHVLILDIQEVGGTCIRCVRDCPTT